DITHDPREAGDQPGRFNPPDCVDGALDIGSSHCYPSHHLRSVWARAIKKKLISTIYHASPPPVRDQAAVSTHVFAPPSYIWRISHSPSPATWRNCLANSIASCFELARSSAKPPTTSLASVKGPSVTLNFPSAERRTRARPGHWASSPQYPGATRFSFLLR